MDVIATVRNRLLAIGAVTALVATRVTTGMLPQSSPLPAVLVQRVDGVERSHLRGAQSLMVTRVQVTSVAKTRAAAVAVDESVQGDGVSTGLTNWSGTVGSPSVAIRWMQMAGVREGYDPGELQQYRIDRDYLVHHRR